MAIFTSTITSVGSKKRKKEKRNYNMVKINNYEIKLNSN